MKPLTPSFALFSALGLAAAAAAQQPDAGVPSHAADVKATAPGLDPAAGRRTPSPFTARAAMGAAEKRVATAVRETLIAAHERSTALVFDQVDARTTCVAAPHWKATFRPGAWAFHARQAAGASRPMPLELAVASARVANVELARQPGPVTHDASRVVLDHGAFREVVVLSPERVEQTFVFDELPARGPLTLAVRATTPLTGADVGDGVTFTGEHLQLHYGEAVAIDALGRTVHAPTTFADGVITIDVPAEFVETAALPLVVDPVVESHLLIAPNERYLEPDVAWDQTYGVWAVVYQFDFDALDQDVYLQRFDADLQPVGVPVGIDVSTISWQYPRIANNNHGNCFLVVAQVQDAAAPQTWIGGRIVGGNGTMQAPFDVEKGGVASHASGNKLFPDVGGDPENAAGQWFTVVWERVWNASDHDIHAKQVSAAGVLRTAAPFFVENGGEYDGAPALSNSCGAGPDAAQRFGLVWERTVGSGNHDVYATVLDDDGVVQLPLSLALATGLTNQVRPAVSSPSKPGASAQRLLVVWEDATLAGGDVLMALLQPDGQVVTTANLSALNHSTGPNPHLQSWPHGHPTVDCDGARFSVMFLEGYLGAPGDPDTYVSLVAEVGGALVVQNEPRYLTASQHVCKGGRIASRYASTGAESFHYATVDSDEDPTRELVTVRTWHGYQDGWQLRPRPAGCGPLTMFSSGSTVLGQSFTLSLSTTSGLVGFLVGDYVPATVLPPCPECTAIVANPFALLGPVLAVNVPWNPALVGAVLGIQGFEWGPGSCFGAMRLSNGFEVTVR